MKTLVILPTYNEAGNIRGIAEKILSLGDYVHILIVDDNSADGTREIAGELTERYKDRVFLLERPGKLGLGSAYVQGFRFALEKGYDYVFEMDSDWSHDPQEIPNLLEAAKEADLVIGSRYIGGIRIMNWPLARLALSYSANAYARKMAGLTLSDCTSGFKCFSRKVLEALPLDKIVSNGYAFQIEVNFWCQRLGFKIKEIPIVFSERRSGASKMSKDIAKEAFWLGVRLFVKRIYDFNPPSLTLPTGGRE